MTVEYKKNRVEVLQRSRNTNGEIIFLIQDRPFKRWIRESITSKPEEDIDVGKAYEYFGMEVPDDN